MGQNYCKPQPGDLIEIFRPHHQHWALYVGDGYVINLTPVGKQDLKLGIHKVPVFTRKVKKQLLKEVARNNKWRVNNESDRDHTPLPVEEIIRHAENYTDKQVAYRVFGSNCERFVKKLRYGGQLRAFVGGEMRIPDMTDGKDYPSPGDLIEIKRPAYQHWALYVGDGYVIHGTAVDEGAPSVSASSGIIVIRKAKVTKELLKKVAANDELHVNNKYDCHHTPLPVKEIIRRAERCIGKELPYDVFDRYSEDFVTKLRYGGQAKKALRWPAISSAMTAGIGVVSLPFVPAVPVVAAAGVGLLATLGFASSNIAHSFICAKFVKAEKDILERSCC